MTGNEIKSKFISVRGGIIHGEQKCASKTITSGMRNTIKYRSLPIFILCLLFGNISAQDIIKESTYHFDIRNDASLSGKGADIFKEKISESQFFLIGEEHDVSALENLFKTLIPFLKKEGFTDYMAEIGPVAAEKLTELGKQRESLNNFNSIYSNYLEGAPFGFFGTIEEGETLEQIANYGINLCGIDFENYNSYLFLIDKLYENSGKTESIKTKYKDVFDFVVSEYNLGNNGFNPNLSKNLLKSDKLKNYIDAVYNSKNKIIIDELRKSLQINAGQGNGFWYPRVENMKVNFITQYNQLKKNNKSPKMIIKLGAVHIARGTSFSGFQEVGNTIYELATFNRTKSFSVLSFSRYRINSNNEIEDNIEKEDIEILQYTLSDKWTFIDLEELRKLSIENKIKLDQNIQGYIQKFDAILIPPATKRSKQNY